MYMYINIYFSILFRDGSISCILRYIFNTNIKKKGVHAFAISK